MLHVNLDAQCFVPATKGCTYEFKFAKHCSGDFYIGNANRCSASAGGGANQSYFPQPVAYRRYLPPSPPISMMMAPPQQMQPMGMPPMGMAPQMQNLQPIRGLW